MMPWRRGTSMIRRFACGPKMKLPCPDCRWRNIPFEYVYRLAHGYKGTWKLVECNSNRSRQSRTRLKLVELRDSDGTAKRELRTHSDGDKDGYDMRAVLSTQSR
ncbi:hypothetical protein FPOAC2_11220 [Fusarium poae]